MKTTERGLKPGWTRATFIVKKDQLEVIKNIAHYDRRDIKDVVEEAVWDYLDKRLVGHAGAELKKLFGENMRFTGNMKRNS